MLCGSPDDLGRAIDIIDSIGPSLGLSLNLSKCLLYCPEDAPPATFHPDVPITTDGFSLLGAPIGPPEYCLQYACNKAKKALDLQDSQMEFTLLRSSWSFPKLSYLIRTTPSLFISDALSHFDTKVKEVSADLQPPPGVG